MMESPEAVATKKKHKKIRRHSTRLDVHAQSLRRPPEGDSIIQKEPMKLAQPSMPAPKRKIDKTANAKKRKLKNISSDSGLETANEEGNFKKSKNETKSDFLTSIGPLNDISSIHPVLDNTLDSTFSKKSKSKLDVTWEKAVCSARGQPDGAELSMRIQKLTSKTPQCSVIQEHDENDHPSVIVEEPKEEVKKAEKKTKSLKVKVKGAMKKLKKLKETKSLPSKLKKLTSTEAAGDAKRNKKTLKNGKETKKDFKKLRNNYTLIQSSKNIWEELRKHDLTVDRRVKLCNQLMEISKGKTQMMAFTHDGARVLQCLIQYGNMEQRAILFDELKHKVVEMVESKYAKFIVRKFLTYGSKSERSAVFKSLCGQASRLIRHREASEVIEFAYNEYANATQRQALLEDFYGATYKFLKNDEMTCLEDMFNAYPKKKDTILDNMKEILVPLIEKNLLTHSIIHRLFSEYFLYADKTMRTEMITELREGVVNMVHSRDGARVAMKCIWYGNTKDRKVILKSFKGYIQKMCEEEYAHQVLLAAFDAVDDTKLLSKVILEEILKSLKEIASNSFGRKLLLYLLAPRDPLHFHPDVIKIMQEGDDNEFSKKDSIIRHSEILDVISKPLLKFVTENTKDLVSDNNSLLFLVSIITHAKGDKTKAMEAVAEICAETMDKSSLGDLHIVEHPAGHITLKKLIAFDKENYEANKDDNDNDTVYFSLVLLNTVPVSVLKSWAACNRGCFILLAMLEINHPEVAAILLPIMKTMSKSLKMLKFKGAQLLFDFVLYNTKD
ncbi:pumilio homolog 3-like [Argonauta hians]